MKAASLHRWPCRSAVSVRQLLGRTFRPSERMQICNFKVKNCMYFWIFSVTKLLLKNEHLHTCVHIIHALVGKFSEQTHQSMSQTDTNIARFTTNKYTSIIVNKYNYSCTPCFILPNWGQQNFVHHRLAKREKNGISRQKREKHNLKLLLRDRKIVKIDGVFTTYRHLIVHPI